MSILFSPAQLGTLQLRNRLVMTPMHLGYSPKGVVNDQLIEFYRARARGGVGLIIVGGCGIDQIGNAFGMTQFDDDRFIPGLRQLVDVVHAEGAKIMPQLYQAVVCPHRNDGSTLSCSVSDPIQTNRSNPCGIDSRKNC